MGKDGFLDKLNLANNIKNARSTYSLVSFSEVTDAAAEVWHGLPVAIRDDPSLASFRTKHEKLHGPDEHNNEEDEHDVDPLPNHDDHHQINDHGIIGIDSMSSATKGFDAEISKLNPGGNNATAAHAGHPPAPHHERPAWFNRSKIVVLVIIWLMFTIILMRKEEKKLGYRQLSVPVNNTKDFILTEIPINPRVGIYIKGAFSENNSNDTNKLQMYIQLTHYREINTTIPGIINNNTKSQSSSIDPTLLSASDILVTETISLIKNITIVPENRIDFVDENSAKLEFSFGQSELTKVKNKNSVLSVRMSTDYLENNLPLKFTYDPSPIDKESGVIYAAIILLGLYGLIIWEVVHRTFAAILASTTAIAVLAAMNERPEMSTIMSWIDVETLLLLFGMMILVAILSETGIFDYLAVYAYKITNGRVWPLINCLCIFTAVLSSFLDNVTTVLLMTPVSIRLCEVMGLNPVPILMAMVIYSNVGGATTPVGDPPNVIIASNKHISGNGVTFLNFTLHLTVGIVFVLIQTHFQLRWQFRDMNKLRFTEPSNIRQLRQEISVWQRAAASLSSYSKDEDLVRETLLKKVNRLDRQLKKSLTTGAIPVESYKATLEEMQAKYPIRNVKLLIQSSVVLVFVITFFFLHSMPHIQRLSLGWTALLGACLLLILSDREDMESVLARVEWSTLLFFAALFILMEALGELGLIAWIGRQTESVILSVSEESRLAVAILIILWVSALASAFVDNIPLTTMMVKIAISLAENEELGLPLQPLVWALAFGACLGGNGTLIGASANVVCAGVAEQHGYRFTFVQFFKVGFPLMIGSIIVTTVYLMVAHVLFQWH